MSGHVYYRFKAQKEPARIVFNGTGISVWDLKREIILENKMGKGSDFDIAIYNADTEEEYVNDHSVIPRSSSVVVRRMPPHIPGRGNGQYYVADIVGSSSTAPAPGQNSRDWRNRGPMSKRFDQKDQAKEAQSAPKAPLASGDNEAEGIAAMFAATSEQWDRTQERMASQTKVYSNPKGQSGGPRQAPQVSHKPPPNGYICYRCGQKGHWIQECPTNENREFDNRPRIKRTTGIPRSFLQEVEGPGKEGNQGGVMVTPDGTFVTARPDSATWEKHRAVIRNVNQADVQDMQPTDPDLTCSLDNKLLKDATKTPCCSSSFCEECIHDYLLEHDLVCPECEAKLKSLEQLVVDQDRRVRVREYVDMIVNSSRKDISDEVKEDTRESEQGTPAAEDAPPTSKDNKPASPSQQRAKSKSPSEIPPKKERELRSSPKDTRDRSPGFANPPSHRDEDDSKPTLKPFPSAPQPSADNFHAPQQFPFPPQMLHAQIAQASMLANNPNLAPQMRMQAQMQLSNLRMMAMNSGMGHMMNQGSQFNGMPNFGMMGGGGGWNNGFSGPVNDMGSRQPRQKRPRPSDFVEIAPAEKAVRSEAS